MIAWGISPPLQIGDIFRTLLELCFIVWSVLAIKKCGRALLDFYIKLFAFLFLIIGIAWMADGFQTGVIANLQMLIFFCYLPVFFYYHQTKESPVWVFALILILVAVFNTTTLWAYTENRNISRMMSKSFDGMEVYLRRGVGGYGYIYSIVLSLPLLFGITVRHFRSLNIVFKILTLYALVTSVFTIYRAGYAIAMIISIVSIAVLLIYRKRTQTFIPLMIIIVVALVVVINLEDILWAVVPLVKGTKYEVKVNDIISSLMLNESVGTVGGRTERYIRSISLFFKSPIWGQLSRADVGKHSAILDRFAQFGFLLGGIFLYFVSYAQRVMNKDTFDKGIAVSILVASLMLFSLNNIGYSMGVMLFVLYPVLVNFVKKNEDQIIGGSAEVRI